MGEELRRRGHRVVVLTAEPFRAAVQAAGLEFEAVFSRERFERALGDPDLWDPFRGLQAIFRLVDRAALDRSWAALERWYEPGRTVLVGHPLSFPTRVFEERRGVPAVTVQLAPIAFRTLHLQPILPPRIDPNAWPRWLRRLFWWAADRWGVDPVAGPTLHPFLRHHGLAPQRRLFRDWIHSPRRVLGFFPPWFGPPQPDWPSQARLVGFPLHDGYRSPALDEALARWIADGPPPVVFTPGSAHRQASPFFAAAARATSTLGMRALFVTPWASQLPDPLPPHVHHATGAPFRALFPRCAAAVHHGGIGTTAQALAAGIPQIVQGRSFDQPDNGVRLERLGVGRLLANRHFDDRELARVLAALLRDPEVAAATERLAGRMKEDGGAVALARAADEIEAQAVRDRAAPRDIS